MIKTHKIPRRDTNLYDKIVLIIRNPFDAILAEFNRVHSSKTSVAPKEEFQSESRYTYLKFQIHIWSRQLLYSSSFYDDNDVNGEVYDGDDTENDYDDDDDYDDDSDGGDDDDDDDGY